MVKKQASSLYQNLLNNIQESWTKVFITDKENSQQKNQFMKAHFKKEKSMGSENKFFLLQDWSLQDISIEANFKRDRRVLFQTMKVKLEEELISEIIKVKDVKKSKAKLSIIRIGLMTTLKRKNIEKSLMMG